MNHEHVFDPFITILDSFSTQRFWDTNDNRKWAVFLFNLSSHNHICIAEYRFSIREA